MFKKYLNIWLLIISLFIICGGSGPLAAILISKQSHIVTSTSNDWIGFLGSFLGGIAGGMFTLFGVIIAFKLERHDESIKELPQKISTLNLIEAKIRSHKFSNYIEKNKFEDISYFRLLEMYGNDLEVFKREIQSLLEDERKLIKLSSSISTRVFVTLQNYFMSLQAIDEYVSNHLLESPNTPKEIQESYSNILLSIKYHLDSSKITLNNLKEERECFLKLVHGQKDAKNIDTQFKHEYLKNLIQKPNK
jgi:hypothetical protein